MKLKDLSKKLECELTGSPEVEIYGIAGIEEATANQLTFVSNPKYYPKIQSTMAGAIILAPDAPTSGIPTLVSKNPYLTFAHAIPLFYRPPSITPGIHPTAIISETAKLGKNHSIGAHVVIGDGVQLGKNATLYANVVLYPHAKIGDNFLAHSNSVVREYCRLGNRVTLQNGVIIGGDGFGYAPKADSSYFKMVQSGTVVLEDDVEVGSNACIDRSTVGETRVGKGTKIDNLVQIGHGSSLGNHNIIASQTGLAGTTTTGNNVILAGQVGVAGHLKIGDGAVATAQTGIGRDVAPGSSVSGSPEMETVLWKRNFILMHKFPRLVKTVNRLEKEIEKLLKSDSS